MSKPRAKKKETQYEVEQILAVRLNPDTKTVHSCLIKWKGYDDTHNSWEPNANVDAAPARNEALTHICSKDPKWKWEYYLAAPQDGYAAGWHPFDQSAQDCMSKYFHAFCESNGALPGKVECVISGTHKYPYEIDFDAMKQTNVRVPARTTRRIRCTPDLE